MLTSILHAAYHVGRTLLRLVLYAADARTLDEDSPFTKALLEYWKVSHIDELLEKTVSLSQLSRSCLAPR